MKTVMNALKKSATYSLTLPERVVCSVASVASGAFDAASEVLLPAWMKKTTSYRVTLGMMHKFINVNIVGLTPEGAPLDEKYLHKKTAGTVLEAAGLALFRFSPLWLFAIISDTAGGSKVYIDHLSAHLKENGLVPEDASTDQIKSLLESIQASSDTTASVVDMPPLSIEEAGKTAQDILSSYAMTGQRAIHLLPDVEDIWNSIQALSKKGISFDAIAGILTLDAAKNVAWSTASATAEVVDDHIIKSYRQTLKNLETEGPAHYIARKMTPYMVASIKHFSPSKATWTEKGIQQAGRFGHWVKEKLEKHNGKTSLTPPKRKE